MTSDFFSKRVTVFGLGRFGGGIAVTRWLVGQGASVVVADQDPPARLAGSVNQLRDISVEFRLGELSERDFTAADLIVASPAIPPHHPLLAAARAGGVPITTEIRLFIERCPVQVFGITGTKGKSTTTAMLGRMLARRFRAHVGGNIGGSLLQKLPEIGAEDRVVLELSSYMLEHLGAARWSPHVAVVTMLGVDHVEWHRSREAYLSAKKNILRFQTSDDYAILNAMDEGAGALASEAKGHVVSYGLPGARPFALLMPGQHNQINAQGAFAAAQIAGNTWDEAQTAVADMPALPHRLELVHESDGVRWINDSIATIPNAAVAALESFPPNRVVQIIGGKDKHLAVEAMCTALAARAKAVLCIGATEPMLTDALRQAGANVVGCGDLATAVTQARELAGEGDVVLLSPGYPSYDQFVNLEERGELFSRLARNE